MPTLKSHVNGELSHMVHEVRSAMKQEISGMRQSIDGLTRQSQKISFNVETIISNISRTVHKTQERRYLQVPIHTTPISVSAMPQIFDHGILSDEFCTSVSLIHVIRLL